MPGCTSSVNLTDDQPDAQMIYSTETGGSEPFINVTFITAVPPLPITDIVTNESVVAGDNFPNSADTNYIVLSVVSNSNINISLSKSISDIRLGGVVVSSPVPGSTVTYQINYSNQGPVAASNMIIYDQLPGNVIYISITPTGWIEQYSYSAGPDQSYGSADYTNMPPAVSSNVRYVRWINSSVPAGEAGSFTYTVIIR